MAGSRSSRDADRPVSIQTGVGHAQVVPDPSRPEAATLFIDGFVHGHVDASDMSRLKLDYQARLTTIILALLPDRPARVAHLGGGAFAIPRAVAASRPDVTQTVFERSAAIIKLARRHLGLRPDDRLVVRKGDGRAGLARIPDGALELVVGDAFVNQDTPRHMTTVEFMAEIKRVLAPGGCYVVNIIDAQPWSKLGVQTAAASAVFADVAAAGSRGVARLRDPGNVFLIGAVERVPRATLQAAGAVARHPLALMADGRLVALGRTQRLRHDTDG